MALPNATILDVRHAGRRVAASTLGTGEPAVVLLTGLGVPAGLWSDPPTEDIQTAVMTDPPWRNRASLGPAIAEFARVVVYDRAGIGESESPPIPRGLDDLCAELEAVMDAADTRRALLVGHSLGGLIAYTFARRRPARAAGLVLLDASHPDQNRRFEAVLSAEDMNALRGLFARLRDGHPERPDLAALTRHGPGKVTPGALGALPLAVVHKGLPERLERARQTTPGATSESVEATFAVWRELQAEYAATSTRSESIVAERSGHYVHWDEPETAIRAIRRVWNAAKDRNALFPEK